MSKQTLVTARERLAKRKLISFTNGTTRFQPSKYSLLELTEDLSVHLTEDLTLNNKEVDIDKTALYLLQEYRSDYLGKMTLDRI